MNKNPCSQPVTFTAIGKPAKYLSGMANSRIMNDQPSRMALRLKTKSFLFMTQMNEIPNKIKSGVFSESL